MGYGLLHLGACLPGVQFHLLNSSSRSLSLWGTRASPLWSHVLLHTILSACTSPHWSPGRNKQVPRGGQRLVSLDCLTPEPTFHSAGPITCTSPTMSSNATSFWTTKLAMIPELGKADWSCSDGQKVIRTQVSPLSIIVDGGKSASPAWVVVRRVHQAESQVKGHQKGQYLGRMRSELCTTCCSIACNAPPHLPNTTCFSQTYNQLPLLCLFQACPAWQTQPPLSFQALAVWLSLTTSSWLICHPSWSPGSGGVSCPHEPGSPPGETLCCALQRETDTQTGPQSPPTPLTAVGTYSLARFSSR